MKEIVTKYTGQQKKKKVKGIICLYTSEIEIKKKEIWIVWSLTYAGSKSNWKKTALDIFICKRMTVIFIVF